MNSIEKTNSNSQPTEIWLTIKNYPTYEVSNLGQVRSNYADGTSLILSQLSNGKAKYKWVSLLGKKHYIHQLVLSAFVSEKPEGYECDHINRNPEDNRLSNLRYQTIHENRSLKGEEHGFSKLTDDKVRIIRQLYNSGFGLTQKRIGELFDVSARCIGHVILRQTWSHI